MNPILQPVLQQMPILQKIIIWHMRKLVLGALAESILNLVERSSVVNLPKRKPGLAGHPFAL